jgi:hypothetical protein
MSKRLQVLLDEEEFEEIDRAAKVQKLTVAEWVRRVLREARRRQPATDGSRKLAVIRAAAGHAFPVADVDQMLAEIEQGYRLPDEP